MTLMDQKNTIQDAAKKTVSKTAAKTPSQRMREVLSMSSTQSLMSEVLRENKEEFVASLIDLYGSDNYLAQCDPGAVMKEALKAVSLKLPINKQLGFAYIVPYRDGKTGQQTPQFQLGYKGLIQLAQRTGAYASMNMDNVYEGELRVIDRVSGDIDLGGERTSDKVIGYFAYIRTVNGFSKTLYWPMEKMVSHAKKYSKSYNAGAAIWKNNFNEMAQKGLSLDTLIPTPNGFVTMDDIVVGDVVFDMDGNKTIVRGVSEIKNIDCFKVTFSNGEEVVCDDEHRWVSAIGSNAARKVKECGWEVHTINHLYEAKVNGQAVVVPVVPCIDFDEKELKIPPYLLGYWLGNGNKHGAVVCVGSEDASEIESILKEHIEGKYMIGSVRKDKRSNATNIGIVDGFRVDLSDMGLLLNKHIPGEYLRSSKEQRLNLLRGLMDSDGSICDVRSRARFSTVDPALAEQMYELVSSLGEVAHITKQNTTGFGKTVLLYNVGWKPTVNPFSLSRKRDRFEERMLLPYKAVKSIERIDSVPTRCIAVSSPTSTYLVGKGFVPTHNTVMRNLLSRWGIMSVDLQHAINYEAADLADAAIVDEETGEILPSDATDTVN